MAAKKAAKASKTKKEDVPSDDAIVAALGDDDAAVRKQGLEWVARYDVTMRAEVPAGLVDGLRKCVREAPDPGDARHAIFVLGHLGPKGAAAVLDVVRALDRTENPYQAYKTLVAFGSVPPEARPILEGFVRGDDSGVADAATRVLDKLLGGAPSVSPDAHVARMKKELASKDPDVRYGAIFAAKKLGAAGANLIPALTEVGERAARGKSVDDRVELDAVRETLLALGCPPHELPSPPSRYEAHRGAVPNAKTVRVDGAYAVGEITTVVEHGVVGVPLSSHGVWNEKTGKLLFLVDGAQLLTIVPGRKEAAVLRTSVRRDAKHGGTSRADHDWFFERYAIPSGEKIASLAIPKAFTGGWPAGLTVRDVKGAHVAEIIGGDEDAPYVFDVKLGTGKASDELLDDAPRTRRRGRTSRKQ